MGATIGYRFNARRCHSRCDSFAFFSLSCQLSIIQQKLKNRTLKNKRMEVHLHGPEALTAKSAIIEIRDYTNSICRDQKDSTVSYKEQVYKNSSTESKRAREHR